ncbi:MAG: hypothetical protein M3088_01990 [Actinomycetota bacterium]|nr:hypothetical protein [Actinomycetota bacterium]
MKPMTALPLRRAGALAAAVAASALVVLFLLGPVAPASAHHIWKKCENVGFTPNSGDVAAYIRVRRIYCSYARDFIRDFDAAPAERYAGYVCSWRNVDGDIPYTRFRCDRGTQTMVWHRYP